MMDSDLEFEQQEDEIDELQNLLNRKIKKFKLRARRNRKLRSNVLIADLMAFLAERITADYNREGRINQTRRVMKRKWKRVKMKSTRNGNTFCKNNVSDLSTDSETENNCTKIRPTRKKKKRTNIASLLLSCRNQNGQIELPRHFVLEQNSSKRFNFFLNKDNRCTSSPSMCMQPLEMDDILPNVFKLLDFETLQSCRLVSKLWNFVTTREILQRGYIAIPYKFRSPRQDKEKYLSVMSQFRQKLLSVSIKITNIHIKDLRDIQILKNLQIISPNVLHLAYDPDWEEVQGERMEKLFYLLQDLPNLESLTTGVLDLFPSPFWYENNDQNWIQILLKLESLKEIQLNRSLTNDHLQVYSQIQDKLRSMQLLCISKSTCSPFLGEFISQINWNIQEVILPITPDLSISTVRSFFNKIAHSLKKLTINLYGLTRDPNDLVWNDTWFIPLTLTSLESLTVSSVHSAELRVNETFGASRALVVGLQLPKLTKISIHGLLGSTCQRMLDEWAIHHENRMPHSVVQELEIHFSDCGGPSSLAAYTFDIWKNLTSLGLQMKKMKGSFNFTHFLFSLNHLESLHLDLEFSDDLTQWEWDTLLTGIKRPNNWSIQREGTIFSIVPRRKSLLNLSCLKVLTIDSGRHEFLSDFFIYNALIHMKTLQRVGIEGSKFSVMATQDLRQILGPHVYIKLDNH